MPLLRDEAHGTVSSKSQDAPERKGESFRASLAVFLMILLFVVVALAPRIFIFVNAGEGGVLFRRLFGGVDTTRVYGEGLHLIFP